MAMRTSVSRPISASHRASAIDRVWRTNAFISGSPNSEQLAPRNPPPKPGVPAMPTRTSPTRRRRRRRRARWRPRRLDHGADLVGGVALVVVVAEHDHDRDRHRRQLGGEHLGLGRRAAAGQVAGDEQHVGRRRRALGRPRTGSESRPTWMSPTAAIRTVVISDVLDVGAGGDVEQLDLVADLPARRQLGDDRDDGVAAGRRRPRCR